MADVDPTVAPVTPPASSPPAAPPTGQPPLPGVTVPPVAAAPQAPGKGGKKKGGKEHILKLSDKEFSERFMKRVNSMAVSMVKQKLGVSLEEAEKIVKAGGTPAGTTAIPGGEGAAAAATANQALDRLKSQNQQLQGQIADLQKKHQKSIERLQDRLVEKDLKIVATQAGIKDVDYALTLYARAVVAAKNANQDKPKPEEFFGGLKAAHAYLFANPTPSAPVVVAPTTAPPESRAPGEVTPPAAPPGAPPKQANADDMTPEQFREHSKQRYGFVPGT